MRNKQLKNVVLAAVAVVAAICAAVYAVRVAIVVIHLVTAAVPLAIAVAVFVFAHAQRTNRTPADVFRAAQALLQRLMPRVSR